MAKFIPFTRQEAAILLDGYLKSLKPNVKKEDVIRQVSDDLRKLAINNGLKIDAIYRNYIGITFQLMSMESAFLGYTKVKPASKLFKETVDLYNNHTSEYTNLLIEAREIISQSENTKQIEENDAFLKAYGKIKKKPITIASLSEQKYYNWLQRINTGKDNLDVLWDTYQIINSICAEKRILKKPLFETTDVQQIKKVQKYLSQTRVPASKEGINKSLMLEALRNYLSYIEQMKNKDLDIQGNSSTDSTPDGFAQLIESDKQNTVIINGEIDSLLSNKYPILYKKVFGIMNVQTNPLYFEDIQKALGMMFRKADILNVLNLASWILYNPDGSYYFNSKDEDNYKTKNPKLFSELYYASSVYDDPSGLSLDNICNIIRTSEKTTVKEILEHVPWAYNIGGNIYTFHEPAFQRSNYPTLPQYKEDHFKNVLLKRYPNGMMFDSIDLENFKDAYEEMYSEKVDYSDKELESILRKCGVVYKTRVYPELGIMDDETKTKLFSYISDSFESGKSTLYYQAIYDNLSDVFMNCYTLVNSEMLREFIKYTSEEGKYVFYDEYMSIDKDVQVNHKEEIAEFYLTNGKPCSIDDAAKVLSHIPSDRIREIITLDPDFVRNAKGEYFHKDIFEISDDEKKIIIDLINELIEENEFAVWPDVWRRINEQLPLFIENNVYLSSLGVRNIISRYLKDMFAFNNAVISPINKNYDVATLYRLFAKHHARFSKEELIEFSKTIEQQIYYFAVYDEALRIDEVHYISKGMVDFDTNEIDSAIGSFFSKDYICLSDLNSFMSFPYVGYEWNEFLLEGYLHSFSKKFTLYNNGFSNKITGVIAKNGGCINSFYDACVAVVADSTVPLKTNEVLDYLLLKRVIAVRRYKEIGNVLNQVEIIRRKRGS